MPQNPSLFGLSKLDEMELLNKRVQERQLRTMQNVQSLGASNPAQQTGNTIGGLFGNWLGSQINKPKLTPQEQAQKDLNERIHARYNERTGGAAGAKMSEEDKAMEMQMAAADANFEQGNYDAYNQLVMETAQQKRARAQGIANQALLDNAVGNIDENNAVLAATATKAQAGDSFEFIMPGEDPLVAMPRVGRLMPDQSVEVHNKDGSVERLNQYMPLDQALAIGRLKESADNDGNGQLKVNQLWSTDQRTERANAPLAQLDQANIINGMLDAVSDVIEQGGDPDTLMQTPGGILSFADKVRATAKAGKNYVTDLFNSKGELVFKGDMASDTQRKAYLEKDPDAKAAFDEIVVPGTLKTEAERQAWRSAVFQLAWTTWRSSEGSGARQASNQDFLIALDELGAKSGSIRSMLSTAVHRLSRGQEKYNNLVLSTRNQGIAGGWTQDRVDQQIFGGMADRATSELTNALSRADKMLQAPPDSDDLNLIQAPDGIDPALWQVLTPEEQREYINAE